MTAKQVWGQHAPVAQLILAQEAAQEEVMQITGQALHQPGIRRGAGPDQDPKPLPGHCLGYGQAAFHALQYHHAQQQGVKAWKVGFHMFGGLWLWEGRGEA